jgi:hypothetical protein
MAATEALSLQFNLEPEPTATLPSTPSPEAAWILFESGRRLWYAIYLSEGLSAIGLARPSSITAAECQASAPVADKDWDVEVDKMEPLVRVPPAVLMDGWDSPPATDAVLDSEWAHMIVSAKVIDEVLGGFQRLLRMAGLDFFAPRTKNAVWVEAYQRFALVRLYLDRVYMRLPAWLREFDRDPEAFMKAIPEDVERLGDVAIAKGLYALSVLHAAYCCLFSPPTPTLESGETQVWMAHGRGDPGLIGSEGPEELFHVVASVPARMAGAAAFDGFPVAAASDGGLAASPVSLCFFHQRRRAAMTPAILHFDPDGTYRNGIAGILASQVFMLRLLLRDMYIENALGRLAGQMLAGGKELSASEAEALIVRGKKEGEAAAGADFSSHLHEAEPSAKQHRAGAAALIIARALIARALDHKPVPGAVGNNRFVGLPYSSFGTMGGELKEGLMKILLGGPDKADPGVKEAAMIEDGNADDVVEEAGSPLVPL